MLFCLLQLLNKVILDRLTGLFFVHWGSYSAVGEPRRRGHADMQIDGNLARVPI